MTENNLKIGIIGCGWIADHAHIPSFQNTANADIVALFDTDHEKASALAKKHNIKNVYAKYQEVLESNTIDAVVICTPNFTHYEYSKDFLENGKHVLCEKPISFSSDEVRKLVAISQSQNKVFIPGFVNRFRKDISTIAEMISEKTIGKVVEINAGWLRKSGIPGIGSWFTDREQSGGGVLIDLGSHIIDISQLFSHQKKATAYKLKVSSITKNSVGNAGWYSKKNTGKTPNNVETSAVAEIWNCDSSKLNIYLSWNAPIENDCTFFSIKGDRGTIRLQTLFGFSPNRLWAQDSITITSGLQKKGIVLKENSTKHAFNQLAAYFTETIMKNEYSVLSNTDAILSTCALEELYKNSETVSEDSLLPDLLRAYE